MVCATPQRGKLWRILVFVPQNKWVIFFCFYSEIFLSWPSKANKNIKNRQNRHTTKLNISNQFHQTRPKILFSGKLFDSPWSLTQTPWRWTTRVYWQKRNLIQTKLTRKTNCLFIHCEVGFKWWMHIVQCVCCSILCWLNSINVAQLSWYRKRDWQDMWSREWSGKYFISV